MTKLPTFPTFATFRSDIQRLSEVGGEVGRFCPTSWFNQF